MLFSFRLALRPLMSKLEGGRISPPPPAHPRYENWRARARVNAALTIVRDGNALTRALLGYSAERAPLSRERMAVARRARGQESSRRVLFKLFFLKGHMSGQGQVQCQNGHFLPYWLLKRD